MACHFTVDNGTHDDSAQRELFCWKPATLLKCIAAPTCPRASSLSNSSCFVIFMAWLCPVGSPDGPLGAKHLFSFLEEVVGPTPCLEATSPFRASGVSIDVCLGSSLTAHLNKAGGRRRSVLVQ